MTLGMIDACKPLPTLQLFHHLQNILEDRFQNEIIIAPRDRNVRLEMKNDSSN